MFKYLKQLTSLVAMVAVLFTFTTETMAAKKSKTLKNTKKVGFVKCGVSQGLAGFSAVDAAGNWEGVDVDVCRAVAAAVLGDSNNHQADFLGIGILHHSPQEMNGQLLKSHFLHLRNRISTCQRR